MKLTYTLLLAILTALYAVLKNYFPDFPISLDVIASFAAYVLVKLGAEVVEPPVRAFFIKRGFKSFIRG